jgi:hypothetical protein
LLFLELLFESIADLLLAVKPSKEPLRASQKSEGDEKDESIQ